MENVTISLADLSTKMAEAASMVEKTVFEQDSTTQKFVSNIINGVSMSVQMAVFGVEADEGSTVSLDPEEFQDILEGAVAACYNDAGFDPDKQDNALAKQIDGAIKAFTEASKTYVFGGETVNYGIGD